MERRTKIVATIGPASQDEAKIRHLIKFGMNVARLNLSHGNHTEHTQVYNTLRKISAELAKPICILLDLQGPKIRIGDLPGGEIRLLEGQTVILTTHTDQPMAGVIPVEFPQLLSSARQGERV